MAAINLLPGYPAYITEAFTSSSAAGADTLDCSQCASLMIQTIYVSGSPAGNVDLQGTAGPPDGVDGTPVWGAVKADISVASDGVITLLDASDGPFGLLRFEATDLTDGSVKFMVVGFRH